MPRLVAYGRARIAFLYGHVEVARATIDRNGLADSWQTLTERVCRP